MDNLKFNVSNLLTQDIGATQGFEIYTKPKPDNPDNIKQIKGVVTLMNADTKILGTFQVDATIDLECSRCLKEFPKSYTLNFERQFQYHPQSDSEDLPISPNQTLDIAEAIKEEILLKIPLKPLCKKDCKGIKYNKQ